MDESFDPYRKWLGIPPKDQPPHHYRLLGIELFESDPDVIDHAADRQMAHVRALQSGQHSAISQKLLTELSAARLCLLTPATKASYDQELQARLGAVQHPRDASIPHPVEPRAPIPPLARAAPEPFPAFQLTTRRPSRSSTLAPLGIVSVAGAAILVVAGFIYLNLPPASPEARSTRDADRLTATPREKATPQRQTPDRVAPLKQPLELPDPSNRPTVASASESWISREATYAVSSTGEGVLALPSLLTDEDPEREYAIHTKGGEAGAHIVIDLGAVKKITRMELVNRRDPALYQRAKGMQLWLAAGADDGRFPLPPHFGQAAWTAEEGLALYHVKLDPPIPARFIKLGFPPERTEFLHLAKVRVYGYH